MRALSEVIDEINEALYLSDCQQVKTLLTQAFPIVDSRTIVKIVAEMAESRYSQKRIEQAELYFRLAITLNERCFPSEIPARFAKRRLAEVLQEQDKLEEAQVLLASLEMI